MMNGVITEDVVEKLTGKKLGEIVDLNLSGRKLKRIDRTVLQKMTSLTALNLSDNQLRLLPSCVGLTALRHLDVSENCLSSLEFVEKMPQLEGLCIEGNGLKLADKFIAVFLCPSLLKIDGKPTIQLKHNVDRCRNRFLPPIESSWVENFAEDYAEGINTEDLDHVMQQLVSKVKSQKLGAPGVPPSFREFMIDKLATDVVMQAASGNYKPRSLVDESAADEPMDADMEEHSKISTEQSDVSSSCPAVCDYNPVHFIRCHFGDKNAIKERHTDNDPTDNVTSVWCCAMEPDPHDAARDTGIVATCGGDTVCLIDCGTGQVMKRFKQQKEEFCTVAWTTLTLNSDGSQKRSNILAVGGFNGHLRLLHPAQLVCYAEHGSGRPNRSVRLFMYNCLAFHPQKPTLLFCGSTDTTITLFDVGIPHGDKYKTDIRQLAVFTSTRDSPILNMVFNVTTSYLVAGTEKGCFAWKFDAKCLTSHNTSKRREAALELQLPSVGSQFVDGMAMVDDHCLAYKCAGDGLIYIINLTSFLQHQHKRATLVCSLQWIQTDTQYVSLGTSNGLLACGDDQGSLWLYDVKSLLYRSCTTGILSHSRKLQWPRCLLDETNDEARKMIDLLNKPATVVVNCTVVSCNAEYIVAVTDCNLVCIWKKAA